MVHTQNQNAQNQNAYDQSSDAKLSIRCYLGLGSNLTNTLGTPSDHIKQAAKRLAEHKAISHVRLSSLYQSVPMGPQDQPDFTNAVVEIDTTLSPIALLTLCQQLESAAMRVKKRHWGERSLDVDILLYGDDQVSLEAPDLTIPHSGMLERNFVLLPLKELNPNLQIQGVAINTLAAGQDWTGLTKLD